MKRTVSLASIRRRLPQGFELPEAFGAFARAAATTDPADTASFQVVWTDPRELGGLTAEAARELVPFLRLDDGALIGFWIAGPRNAPIVHLDHDGEATIVASGFDDFLTRTARRRTGVADLDEVERPFLGDANGRAARRPVAALTAAKKAFARWHQAANALQSPLRSDATERLRRSIHTIARRMLADGLSRVYKPRHEWWDMDFGVERSEGKLRVTFLDFGEWHAVPARYGLEPVLAELVGMARHPRRRRYEVKVTKRGTISIDRDRELLLEPQK